MERETELVRRPPGIRPEPTGGNPSPAVPTRWAPVPDRRCTRRRTRTRTAVRGAAWLTGLAVLITAVLIGLGAHHRLDRTERSEAAALAALHHTQQVAAADHGSWAEVASAAAVRSRTLSAAEGRLSALEFQLSVAQANAFFGGVNISDLDQCLTGVEQSLNELSLSDPEGAVASLTAVSSQCAAAESAT